MRIGWQAKNVHISRLVVLALTLALLCGGAAVSRAAAAPRYGAYPRHAIVINAGDTGPSFRFYQESSDNSIAYDFSYNDGASWQYGGNLGGNLNAGESVAATYLHDKLIVMITNGRTGYRYYKQSQIDAWGVSVQGFSPYWQPLP